MHKHGDLYCRETRHVSIVERRILCEMCPRTFKQSQHLQRHVRNQKDVFYRNYYLTLNSKSCKHCDETFTKKDSLAQHNKASCERKKFHITLQLDFDTLGRSSKKSKRDKSTSVSTQSLSLNLSTILSKSCTFLDSKIIAQLIK